MKTICLHILIIAITITTLQTYAMEHSLGLTIFSEKPHYQSLSNGCIFLKPPNDIFDKISAYCSHTTRCILQLTCKKFYYAASINNLDKLVMHDFVIGDEKEKAAFFKALIKTNNIQLITPLLQHVTKKHRLPQNPTDIIIDINNVTKNDTRDKQYINDSYLIPLLEEALEQDNIEMINRIAEEDIDKDIINQHYKKKCYRADLVGALAGGICCIVTGVAGVSFVLFIVIDSILHPCMNCNKL